MNGNGGLEPTPDFNRLPNGLYQSYDPRTIDIVRGMRIEYDSPPLQSRDLVNIYAPSDIKTGFYSDYTDIHAGQIVYRAVKDIAKPYNTPVFSIPSETTPILYQDPMGGVRPYYPRVQTQPPPSEYSWDRDQMSWREDLMSKQLERRNTNEWGTFQLYNFPDKYFSKE